MSKDCLNKCQCEICRLGLAERIVEYLNSLLEYDREALFLLTLQRVPCNQSLADHKTVQVVKVDLSYRVGLMGILNGLLRGVNPDSSGLIAAEYEKVQDANLVDGELIPIGSTMQLKRFSVVTEALPVIGSE